jgi:Calcineurin-like phosphoesterase
MPRVLNSESDILAAYKEANGDIHTAATILDITPRALHERLANYERKTGTKLRFGKGSRVVISRDTKPNPVTIDDGVVMVASDCHYWPDDISTAHRAFCKLGKQLKPDIVIVNGDEFDGASVSRHGRTGWEQRPSVSQELQALSERMGEIVKATRGAHHLGTFGNHTIRADTYLAAHASAMEGVKGMKFEDWLPAWQYAWAWMVNGHTLIKHRIKGGIHATWNNTADAQVNTVTGHLHNLRVTPRSTMGPTNGGNLYGVDTGMLADPWGPQFSYVEQGPRNWRSGFAVLTFRDGVLMPPELVQVVEEGIVFFRGEQISV